VRSAWDIVDMPVRVPSQATAHDVVNAN
jgi:hypothetical protein